MIQILDERYSNCQPAIPKYNAVCVFSMKTSEIAFKYGSVDFVIVLNENTGKFMRCYSLEEVEKFLNEKI